MIQITQYLRPQSVPEALSMLEANAGAAKLICGGTDVMVQLHENSPKLSGVRCLIDISRLPELRGISMEESGLVRIGAAVTHTEIERSPLLLEKAAFLSHASGTVGARQIRNSGTIGGNICNASLAADTLSPLVALHAEAELASVRGTRTLPVQDIMQKGGRNALEPDELMVSVRFRPLDGYITAFIKLGRRKALAISRMNVAAAIRLEDGVIRDARVVPGCVFSRPEAAGKAEAFLIGKQPSEALAVEAGRLVSQEMIEITGVRWSTEYKQPAIEALTERAIRQIFMEFGGKT